MKVKQINYNISGVPEQLQELPGMSYIFTLDQNNF